MAMMNKQVREADILAATRQYLRIRGWYVIRNQQNMGSHKGLSDLQAVKDGRTVYIETKRPGGKLTADQEKFRAAVEGHGATYLVISTYDEIIQAIDNLEEEYEEKRYDRRR